MITSLRDTRIAEWNGPSELTTCSTLTFRCGVLHRTAIRSAEWLFTMSGLLISFMAYGQSAGAVQATSDPKTVQSGVGDATPLDSTDKPKYDVVPRPAFRPEAGTGVEYSSSGRELSSTFAYVVIGQEGQGYWIEHRDLIRVGSRGKEKETALLSKEFVVGEPPVVKRRIFRINNKDSEVKDPKGLPAIPWTTNAVKLGVESVSVPAGTFDCDHYYGEANGKRIDVWISPIVPPLMPPYYGIVKITVGERKTELQVIYTHERSRF